MDSYRKIALILSISLLFSLPVFPSNLKAIVIGVVLVLIVISASLASIKINRTIFYSSSIIYVFVLITLLWSNNLNYGLSKIQTMASLIIFPVIFSFMNNEDYALLKRKLPTFLLIYILCIIAINIIPFLYFFASNPNYTLNNIFEHYPTIISLERDMGKYSIHPIYMSMHCCISILFAGYIFLKTNESYKRILLIIAIIVVTFFLILYSKKGPIISLLLVCITSGFFLKYRGFVKASIPALVLVTILVFIFPNVQNRFLELTEIQNINSGESNSTNIRYTIYETATSSIVESPIIGYGIGDANDELYKLYKENNYHDLYYDKLNSHNQYLGILLIGGGLLFTILVLYLSANFYRAVSCNNIILILLLLFYSSMMLTENLLEREDGVVFFSLFLNFFSIFNYKTNLNAHSTGT